MFLDYYGLLEEPFGVTPDTRFLYLNHMYRESLASCGYGIQQAPGIYGVDSGPRNGKDNSSVSADAALRRIQPNRFVFQTCCDSSDLIRYLLHDSESLRAPSGFDALPVK